MDPTTRDRRLRGALARLPDDVRRLESAHARYRRGALVTGRNDPDLRRDLRAEHRKAHAAPAIEEAILDRTGREIPADAVTAHVAAALPEPARRTYLRAVELRGEADRLAPPEPIPLPRERDWPDPHSDAYFDALEQRAEPTTGRESTHVARCAMWARHTGKHRERPVWSIAGHLISRRVEPAVVVALLGTWDAQRNRPPLGLDRIEQIVRRIAASEAGRLNGQRRTA